MQRKSEAKTRAELFVDHVVWNAVAGAALAVMVLLLLCSLQWLDRIAPSPVAGNAAVGASAEFTQTNGNDRKPREVAAVNRPSG